MTAATMKAARIRMHAPDGKPYAFPDFVAPSSAIEIRSDVPMPVASKPGELVIQVKGTTVYRDNLTWNELYPPGHAHLGNDFSGIVVAVHADETEYKVDDHVYGMANADRGGQWAEYALVMASECAKKPSNLSWEAAAALPGSALTADQSLFVQAGLETKATEPKRVLITGASGCAGTFLMKFGTAAGHTMIAATSSKQRNEAVLKELGASEVVEYDQLATMEQVDVVIDSVGPQVIKDCWKVVKPDGCIVSFDSCAWPWFWQEENKKKIDLGKDGVKAIYMIVQPDKESMARVTEHVERGTCTGEVMKTVALDDAVEAYISVHERGLPPGKIVVVP